jgi:hypothetical protein
METTSKKDELTNFKNVFVNFLSPLKDSLMSREEMTFDLNDKVEHVHKSLHLISTETIHLYSKITHLFGFETNEQQKDHFISMLKLIEMNSTSTANEELAIIIQLLNQIFSKIQNDQNDSCFLNTTIDLIKSILFKYKVTNYDLCIGMAQLVKSIASTQKDKLNTNDISRTTFEVINCK